MMDIVAAAERFGLKVRSSPYPRVEGDTIVLGPEIFVSADGEIICWRGENYVKQAPAHLAGINGAAQVCNCPIGHSHQ